MLKNLNDYGDTGRIMLKVLKWVWLWTLGITIIATEIISLISIRRNFLLINFSFLNETTVRQHELFGILLMIYVGLTIIPYALVFIIYIWLPRIKK